MSARRLVAATLLCTGVVAQGRSLAGEWRGTSLCTDLKLAPACHDEQVRYTARPLGASADSVHLVADKLVGGAWELMGEMDFARDAAHGTWTSEFTTRRGDRGRWVFTVLGDSLAGSLVDVATGGRIRAVSARRQ